MNYEIIKWRKQLWFEKAFLHWYTIKENGKKLKTWKKLAKSRFGAVAPLNSIDQTFKQKENKKSNVNQSNEIKFYTNCKPNEEGKSFLKKWTTDF